MPCFRILVLSSMTPIRRNATLIRSHPPEFDMSPTESLNPCAAGLAMTEKNKMHCSSLGLNHKLRNRYVNIQGCKSLNALIVLMRDIDSKLQQMEGSRLSTTTRAPIYARAGNNSRGDARGRDNSPNARHYPKVRLGEKSRSLASGSQGQA